MDPKFEALPPQPPRPPYLPPGPPQPPKSFWQSLRNGVVAIVIGALKFGWLALKSLKMALSLFLLIATYSLLFGWKFAVGLGLILFIHEMGHVVAARILGMPVNAVMFIPFVGAFTAVREPAQDAWTEALFATGGPLAGAIAGWMAMTAGFYFDQPWLVAIAAVNFIINMFNMIPVPPFDGGGMCAAVSRWFWLVGLVMLGLALVYFHSFFTSIFLILIIFFMTLPRLQASLFQPLTEDQEMYYQTHISNRLTMALIYLGILAALMLGYGHASGFLTPLMPHHAEPAP